MKKYLLLMFCFTLIWAFTMPAAAEPVVRELAFEWEQAAEDLPNLKEWRFYFANSEAGPFEPWLDDSGNPIVVPYDGSNGPIFTSISYNVSIDLAGGQKVTYYFILRAVDKDGDESPNSEIAKNPDGTIGVVFKSHLGVPVRVKVTVTIVKPNQ